VSLSKNLPFPSWTPKSVKGMFMIGYYQRVIMRFVWNEGTDANQISTRFQAQFGRHADKLRTVRFWITEVRFDHQDIENEIRTGRRPLDDLDAKFLAIFG
jgi:hypothetical protein